LEARLFLFCNYAHAIVDLPTLEKRGSSIDPEVNSVAVLKVIGRLQQENKVPIKLDIEGTLGQNDLVENVLRLVSIWEDDAWLRRMEKSAATDGVFRIGGFGMSDKIRAGKAFQELGISLEGRVFIEELAANGRLLVDLEKVKELMRRSDFARRELAERGYGFPQSPKALDHLALVYQVPPDKVRDGKYTLSDVFDYMYAFEDRKIREATLMTPILAEACRSLVSSQVESANGEIIPQNGHANVDISFSRRSGQKLTADEEKVYLRVIAKAKELDLPPRMNGRMKLIADAAGVTVKVAEKAMKWGRNRKLIDTLLTRF
jgi:hypothetical protein